MANLQLSLKTAGHYILCFALFENYGISDLDMKQISLESVQHPVFMLCTVFLVGTQTNPKTFSIVFQESTSAN